MNNPTLYYNIDFTLRKINFPYIFCINKPLFSFFPLKSASKSSLFFADLKIVRNFALLKEILIKVGTYHLLVMITNRIYEL